MVGAEKERDEAKEEAQVAQLAAVATSDAREKLEGDLARVKDALAVAEEARVIDECLKHSYYTRVLFMFLVDFTFK